MTVKTYGEKITLEDAHSLALEKEIEYFIDLSDVQEITSAFLGALMHLKGKKNIKMLLSDYVLVTMQMLNIKSYFEENIINL
jgi:hypothetical protein